MDHTAIDTWLKSFVLLVNTRKTKATISAAIKSKMTRIYILDNIDSRFLDATEVILNKLERLRISCNHFIFGLWKYDRIIYIILCVIFNILYNPAVSSYLCDRFFFTHSSDSPCRFNLSTYYS